METNRKLMAISHGSLDPASRFRILQYLPLLRKMGWLVDHRPKCPTRENGTEPALLSVLSSPYRRCLRKRNRWRDVRDAGDVDVVFQNRDLLSGDLKWEQRLFQTNRRVVFDFDDAIYLGPKREEHIGWICRNAAWVTAGNDHLADFARRYTNRVSVVPTVVDTRSYRIAASENNTSERLRLGWLGSDHSIRETLVPHWKLLGDLQREIDFDFVVISQPRPELPDSGPSWRFIPWSPETECQIAGLFDVGIMPLLDDDFQRGKCGLKLLQYMAAGLPVLASPVGVNRQLVPGHGFLVDEPEEWAEAIRLLQREPGERNQLGKAGREFCLAKFDLPIWADRLSQLLESVAVNRSPDE